MKKHTVLILFIFATTFALAQKKEKIIGSKTILIENKEIGNFESIEISDNIEVHLDKGEKCKLKIEADENLHNFINIDLTDKILRISTSKTAINFKRLIVRITYTNDLKMITSKEKSKIYAIEGIELNEITIKSFNNSKLFMNVNTNNFVLQSNDDSEIELNLKSEKATIELSNNTNLKALITSNNLKCDMYQKATAKIEGDVDKANIRLDNNVKFSGNNLDIKNAQLLAESNSNCSINVDSSISIDAVDSAEIELYGNQKIEMKRFTDNASLRKKPNK